jgi:hypothetical protein
VELHEPTGAEIIEILRLFEPAAIAKELNLDNAITASLLAAMLDIERESALAKTQDGNFNDLGGYYRLVAWACYFPYKKYHDEKTPFAANRLNDSVGNFHLDHAVISDLFAFAKADSAYIESENLKLTKRLRSSQATAAANIRHQGEKKRWSDLLDDYDANWKAKTKNNAAKHLAEKYFFSEGSVRNKLKGR